MHTRTAAPVDSKILIHRHAPAGTKTETGPAWLLGWTGVGGLVPAETLPVLPQSRPYTLADLGISLEHWTRGDGPEPPLGALSPTPGSTDLGDALPGSQPTHLPRPGDCTALLPLTGQLCPWSLPHGELPPMPKRLPFLSSTLSHQLSPHHPRGLHEVHLRVEMFLSIYFPAVAN